MFQFVLKQPLHNMYCILVCLLAGLLTTSYSIPLDDSALQSEEEEDFDPKCLLDIHSNITNDAEDFNEDTEEVDFLDGRI